MECPFCIWLAKNNKAWSTKEIDLSLKTPEDPLVYQNLSSTPSKASSLKINSPLPVGFINKGNNCYANVICNPDLTNQLIHQIFHGPSLGRSKSLVMHHLILTLSKMLLRCYSLSLMNWKALQWQPVTWFQIPSESMSRVTNASVSLPKRRN